MTPDLNDADRARLTEHVQRLADRLGIKWQILDQSSSAEPGKRTITTRPIESQLVYLEALHELGHFKATLPLPDDGDPKMFAVELQAWQWAVAQAEGQIEIDENTWATCCGYFAFHEAEYDVWPTRHQRDLMQAAVLTQRRPA